MPAAHARFPYQDPTLAPEARARDLVSRMSIEDKAGTMFLSIVSVGPVDEPNTMFGLPSLASLAINHRLTHLYVIGDANDSREFAQWVNSAQELALRSGLGIPITFSTDPRHGFVDNPAASALSSMFSLWPESIGLAALRSPELVERFADIVRQEYVSVGLRSALHPQIDVATEPRWARAGATFGEDAGLTTELAAAYVRGLQGEKLGASSVSAMAKHFPGGGPQKDGEDPHFTYGKEQVYPGGNFRYHLEPFIAAIDAGVASMMPYYGMPVGTEYEEVGFAFNKAIVTDLLRNQLGFDGVVCTDFGLLTDIEILGAPMPAKAWGLETKTRQERIVRLLDAGVDQFGGEMCTEELVTAVRLGRVPESRLDESVVRLLTQKIELGLFEHPLADEEQAVAIAGNAAFHEEGLRAQQASMTLLSNTERDGVATLPITGAVKVYAENIDISGEAGWTQVDSPEDADIAVLHLGAPFEPRGPGFELFFHAGSLEFTAEEQDRLRTICDTVPTVIDITLDRAAVLGDLVDHAAAVIADYGASDRARLDVLTGRATPMGKLPFDLPSSMDAVRASREDTPFDTEAPTFRFGHGLSYAD
ncbi:glycoside hydrolase family 3 protein [Leifsonia sp. Leaf264]|uniref:glycoside hydrolase family 3 protein n=1 Tax=Leifsonia sp. Leaf264 TaxID=1736314 RepID=UPI0006F88FF4|nr:glycoside hydrolase family 3 N-terminal domain-containing protein [Leifsonia sp. Leaf264]KQP01788.1 beta-glucosidase [Leifsonia sp. Leaf264]